MELCGFVPNRWLGAICLWPLLVRGQRIRAVFLPQVVFQRVDIPTYTGDGGNILRILID